MSSDTIRQRQRPFDGLEKKDHLRPGRSSSSSSGIIHSQSNLRLLFKICIFAIVFVPLLTFLIYALVLPPEHFPVEYSLPDPPVLEGTLEVNNHLLKAEKLFEGKLVGPETIIYQQGHFYTGTADGRILVIRHGEVRTVAHLGKKLCNDTNYDDEPMCGRPLGMKFDPDGYLLVIDTYSGLYRINVATGDVHLLLPSAVRIDGRSLNFLNSLDVASDGMIYLTDSSTYARRDFVLDALDGRPTGRLLRYDPVKNTTEVLLENLRFANGIQLSRYEDFILICETFAARILKYNIKGINAGRAEVFAENLPGTPDNIKLSASGGFWVGVPFVRYQGKSFNSLDFLASRTWLRLLLTQFVKLFSINITPAGGTMILELNSNGKIVRTLMDIDGKHLRTIAEVEDVTGVLYLGSFHESYIARIDTSKLQ